MKFEEVLRMETWVVDVPRARALVKRVHIIALKMRLSEKKSYRRDVSPALIVKSKIEQRGFGMRNNYPSHNNLNDLLAILQSKNLSNRRRERGGEFGGCSITIRMSLRCGVKDFPHSGGTRSCLWPDLTAYRGGMC
jgi:hypothetical protein